MEVKQIVQGTLIAFLAILAVVIVVVGIVKFSRPRSGTRRRTGTGWLRRISGIIPRPTCRKTYWLIAMLVGVVAIAVIAYFTVEPFKVGVASIAGLTFSQWAFGLLVPLVILVCNLHWYNSNDSIDWPKIGKRCGMGLIAALLPIGVWLALKESFPNLDIVWFWGGLGALALIAAALYFGRKHIGFIIGAFLVLITVVLIMWTAGASTVHYVQAGLEPRAQIQRKVVKTLISSEGWTEIDWDPNHHGDQRRWGVSKESGFRPGRVYVLEQDKKPNGHHEEYKRIMPIGGDNPPEARVTNSKRIWVKAFRNPDGSHTEWYLEHWYIN